MRDAESFPVAAGRAPVAWASRWSAWEAWLTPARVYVATFLVLLGLHWDTLFDPPYWDALIGAFPQGLWLARHGFDCVGLLRDEQAFGQGGPCVYPFSVYPALIGVLYASGLAPKFVFLALHLLMLVCAATALAAFFGIARRRLEAPSGTLATLVLASSPLFQAMTAQMNMDMPLVACTLLSLARLGSGRLRAAWGWALLGFWVSPRGILLVAANAAALFVAWVRPQASASSHDASPPRREARAWCLAHAALLAVFALQVWVLRTFSEVPGHAEFGAGLVELVTERLGQVPDFGVALALALVATCVVVRRAVLRAAPWHELACAAFLLVYLAFFANFKNAIPRYFLQAEPYVLLLILWTFLSLPVLRVPRLALLALAFAGNVVNYRGALYAPLKSDWRENTLVPSDLRTNDGHLLERSMEYRDDLLLDLATARRLEGFERESTIVATSWPLNHVLAIPEFGYVERPWRTTGPNPRLTFDPLAVSIDALYDENGAQRRSTPEVDIVWLLSPNVHLQPGLAPWPKFDELVDVLRYGEHRVFLVRRVGWGRR